MYNVKLNESGNAYLMKIEILSEHLIKICDFSLPEAELKKGFKVLTDKGKVYGDYSEFKTIYRKLDDGGVMLSNDGSVYAPPVYQIAFNAANAELVGELTQTPETYANLIIPEVIPDENYDFVGWVPELPEDGELTHDVTFTAQMRYIPTLEEIKTAKRAEISAACESTIYKGEDVEINGEWEHFSLSINDQLNLFGKQAQIAAGATQFEYHQDGHPCKYYSLEDMLKIIQAAMSYVSYHTTYCNALNMWLAGAKTKDEVSNIFYGADVPEEYQSEVLQNYIAVIMADAEAAIENLS